MTNAEIQKLLDDGVAILKQTTVGYANHSLAWQQNQSTKWWQGLDKIAQARKALDPVAAPTPIPGPGPLPSYGFAPGYSILTQSTTERAFNLDQMVDVGGQYVRVDCTPGAQAQLDTLVPMILARGLEPMLILYGTQRAVVAPADAAAFTKAMVAKWKGAVRMFEFCNEPDLNTAWTPSSYTAAAVAAYHAAKAEHPGCYWIVGALWKWKDTAGALTHDWVRGMYAAGIAGKFDAISFHGYDNPATRAAWNIWDHVFHVAGNVRSLMVANGDGAKDLVSSENGAAIATELGSGSYTEADQNTIVAEDFNALTRYASANLKMHTVYTMMNNDIPGWGLLRSDRSRRPAWYTYRLKARGF